ncbi:MAG: four helix bundle protein [Candidatus Margulisiibacteriota bacterium]|nr:four helix bundle protein [Candidatus Margulisiibacteriota bacterium]
MRQDIDIHERVLKFGIRIVKFCKVLSKNIDNRAIADQLIRSGTSVGANMQEADSASSKKDFINKVTIAKKEIQETNYWLKIIKGSDLINNERNKVELMDLLRESDELTRIIGSILSRTKSKLG